MIAVDTNVLVRLVTADHAEQTKRARRLVEANEIWIARTVLLETEWVLRFSYALERARIHSVFLSLLGLATVSVENPDRVALALTWYSQGLDFADALHLANAGPARSFATFDVDLQKKAARYCAGALTCHGP